jgi:hypothetical protein
MSLTAFICAASEPTHDNCFGYFSGTWTPLMKMESVKIDVD